MGCHCSTSGHAAPPQSLNPPPSPGRWHWKPAWLPLSSCQGCTLTHPGIRCARLAHRGRERETHKWSQCQGCWLPGCHRSSKGEREREKGGRERDKRNRDWERDACLRVSKEGERGKEDRGINVSCVLLSAWCCCLCVCLMCTGREWPEGGLEPWCLALLGNHQVSNYQQPVDMMETPFYLSVSVFVSVTCSYTQSHTHSLPHSQCTPHTACIVLCLS